MGTRQQSIVGCPPSRIDRAELDAFVHVGYTIGGMMIFPSNRVDRKNTINGTRGFNPAIKDRFDLTVECIRRHYLREQSPLTDVLDRYRSFFDLFESFRGYAEFFLLQDMVTDDFSKVSLFAPFEDFVVSRPVPTTLDSYRAYKRIATEFLVARNERIAKACSS